MPDHNVCLPLLSLPEDLFNETRFLRQVEVEPVRHQLIADRVGELLHRRFVEVTGTAGLPAAPTAVRLIDQGTDDEWLSDQLKPGSLEQGAIASHYPLELRMREGYDHGYYFVATFIEDHLHHHARALL